MFELSGQGSLVGIVTDYGLDGLGLNPGGYEIFRPSRPALGPSQPPVKWVPGLSRGKVRPGCAADHSPPSSAAVMEEYSYTSTHPLGCTLHWNKIALPLTFFMFELNGPVSWMISFVPITAGCVKDPYLLLHVSMQLPLDGFPEILYWGFSWTFLGNTTFC